MYEKLLNPSRQIEEKNQKLSKKKLLQTLKINKVKLK